MKKIMCELFAGVGGFRLGFDKLKSGWETVWFNQWEPKTAIQHAYNCYVYHFGDSKDITTGKDIATVDKSTIPNHNLLVGGFPCQDYSVARSLSTSKGIQGKQGVLWWQIYETLVAKKPAFCLFENVDRLLKSPSKQRGRDFGIMLTCFNGLGYVVEWRVVNAATYGGAQRRKRIFIFAYKNTTEYAKKQSSLSPENIIKTDGFFSKTFPIDSMGKVNSAYTPKDAEEATKTFEFAFCNAGIMVNGKIHTATIKEVEEAPIKLGSSLEKDVDEKYYIDDEKMKKLEYLKGSKRIPRVAKNGHKYVYSEGAVTFPDDLDKPARTILTSEATTNRSSHIVKDPKTLKLRVLTPIETERIQGFDDNWTNTGMAERMRYFCMGNALVVPMITRMGKTIDGIIAKEK